MKRKWKWEYFDRREHPGFACASLHETDPYEFPFCITKPSPPFAWGEYYTVTKYRWLAALWIFILNIIV